MICTIKLIYNYKNLFEIKKAVSYLRDNFDCKPKFEEGFYEIEQGHWTQHYNSDRVDIWVNPVSISIKLSLWKYYIGNNFEHFHKDQIFNAIAKLQFEYPIADWMQSKVSIIHIGPSLKVSKSPDLYIEKITGKRIMTWSNSKDKEETKVVGSKRDNIIFYNKTKESKKQDKKNIIRIEYRIESPYWMEKHFGNSHPTLEMILDNIDNLYVIWHKKYLSIDKDYSPEINYISSMKEFHQLLANSFGYNNCDKLFKLSYSRGFINNNQKDYGLRYINSLRKKGEFFANEESCMKELDIIVNNFIKMSKIHNLLL